MDGLIAFGGCIPTIMGIMPVAKTDPLLLGRSQPTLLHSLGNFESTIAHVLVCVRLTCHGHHPSVCVYGWRHHGCRAIKTNPLLLGQSLAILL